VIAAASCVGTPLLSCHLVIHCSPCLLPPIDSSCVCVCVCVWLVCRCSSNPCGGGNEGSVITVVCVIKLGIISFNLIQNNSVIYIMTCMCICMYHY
jgi:hypothetical protein